MRDRSAGTLQVYPYHPNGAAMERRSIRRNASPTRAGGTDRVVAANMRRSIMPNIIATHAVGNMETWLAGGDERAAIFKKVCRTYRVFRHPGQARVTLFFEDVDMAKFEAHLDEPAAVAAKAKHTVIEPIEVYVEIANAR
jgi:hypothetical protein